jgi:deazaflavin-dependent oxidoreductase (nitroreductase family)
LPNVRWLIALITVTHRFLYQKTGGLLGASILHMRFLLVTQVGRHSGRERVTPLLCIVEDGRWIVVGSNGGDDRVPAWWLNLQSRPEARVQFRSETVAVKAREATGAEHDALWSKLCESYRYYERYRERTTRQIPVVVLDRTG